MKSSVSSALITLLLIGSMSFLACSNKSAEPAPNQDFQVAEEPDYLEHTITFSGETLGVISRWYTGDAQNWRQIADVNPAIDPRRMSLGDTILIPIALVTRMEALPKSAVPRVSATSTAEDVSTKVVATENVEEEPSLDSMLEEETTQEETAQEEVAVVESQNEETEVATEENTEAEDQEVSALLEELQGGEEAPPSEAMSEREKLLNELLSQ